MKEKLKTHETITQKQPVGFTGVLTGILTGLLTGATPGVFTGGLTGGLANNSLYLHGF